MQAPNVLADGRLGDQLAFLLAADSLKNVRRHNRLLDGSRNENSAEHTWHLTLMAIALAEYAPATTDIDHAIRILVAHDLVEIHAGDHWAGDSSADEVLRKEQAAAASLFSILPQDQARRMNDLWEEYEARHTPEARFARALDALHPMILTWGPGGSDHIHAPLTAASMRAMKQPALEAFPDLWTLARSLLDGAVARGVLPPE